MGFQNPGQNPPGQNPTPIMEKKLKHQLKHGWKHGLVLFGKQNVFIAFYFHISSIASILFRN